MKSFLGLQMALSTFSVIVSTGTCMQAGGQVKRPLTPQDCNNIRYLSNDHLSNESPLQESPDHSQLAYVIQIQDAVENKGVDVLYVAALNGKNDGLGRRIFANERIAAIHWLPDKDRLVAIVKQGGKSVLVEINAKTNALEAISDPTEDIGDYAVDDKADLFALSVIPSEKQASEDVPEASLERGYLVTDDHKGYTDAPPQRQIYFLRRNPEGRWSQSPPLNFMSPLTGNGMSSFDIHGGMSISLSPNGRYLLIDTLQTPEGLPAKWRASPYVNFMATRANTLMITYLYDLVTNQASIPLPSPLARERAIWSPNSSSFARVALPPIESSWEASDMKTGRPSDHNTHLFTVDLRHNVVAEVLPRAERAPLLWADDLLVREGDGAIRRFSKDKDEWVQKTVLRIPLGELSPYGALTTDGFRFLGDYQNATTPPQIFEYDTSASNVSTLVRLNPEIDDLMLPRTETIHWTTSTGYAAKGLLLLPPDYDPSRRYPLVIENGTLLYSGEFVCDSGPSHVSSFARAMLADAGIVYLIRWWPGIGDWENNFFPKGYPGGIAEAEFRMDVVDSAAQYLDGRHMIDPQRIGVIGFSRGGWYTEFALAHSPIRFRAATVTDNAEYSMGEYWYFHTPSGIKAGDEMYGGPPYGSTLKNWMDYSISFNADKIGTPLMIEVMGYGLKDDNSERPPINLAFHFELFTGLTRLGKPVEMYYYPNEQHEIQHPVARIASLQRNIDWFRFWLQGFERANPEDPSQYKRWEHLGTLQDADRSTKPN